MSILSICIICPLALSSIQHLTNYASKDMENEAGPNYHGQSPERSQSGSNLTVKTAQNSNANRLPYRAIANSATQSPNPASTNRGVANQSSKFLGNLRIRIHSCRDIIGKRDLRSDCYILVRTDSVERARTKLRAKQLVWNEEFDIRLDGGREGVKEVEIGLYDKGGDILGMMFFKVKELEKELEKVKQGGSGHGNNNSAMFVGGAQDDEIRRIGSMTVGTSSARSSQDVLDGSGSGSNNRLSPSHASYSLPIGGWFEMEPAGQIQLSMNLIHFTSKDHKQHEKSQNAQRRRQQQGLQRHMAIKKRKLHLVGGHKFSAQRFYQFMKCAYCSEMLIDGIGYQCEGK